MLTFSLGRLLQWCCNTFTLAHRCRQGASTPTLFHFSSLEAEQRLLARPRHAGLPPHAITDVRLSAPSRPFGNLRRHLRSGPRLRPGHSTSDGLVSATNIAPLLKYRPGLQLPSAYCVIMVTAAGLTCLIRRRSARVTMRTIASSCWSRLRIITA